MSTASTSKKRLKRATSPADVPLKYIPCRAFRHEVRFVTDRATTGVGGTIVEFVRVTKCTVCTTVIETTYSIPDFKVKKRTYDYPDQYMVQGGYKVFDARMDYLKARFDAPVEGDS